MKAILFVLALSLFIPFSFAQESLTDEQIVASVLLSYLGEGEGEFEIAQKGGDGRGGGFIVSPTGGDGAGGTFRVIIKGGDGHGGTFKVVLTGGDGHGGAFKVIPTGGDGHGGAFKVTLDEGRVFEGDVNVLENLVEIQLY